MPAPSTPPGRRGPSGGDDGWGPSTAVRGGTAQPVDGNRPRRDPAPARTERPPLERSRPDRPPLDRPQAERPRTERPRTRPPVPRPQVVAPRADDYDRPDSFGDDWSDAGPVSRDRQRAVSEAERRRTERSVLALEDRRAASAPRAPERGVPWWAALVVMFGIAGIGGLIDTVGSFNVQGGYNIGIVAASVVAILLVKRSHMFPIVIAPPIVYTVGAGFQYYLKASNGSATKAKLDAAANYLVYGFPAIAAATALVLLIAGIRLITRK